MKREKQPLFRSLRANIITILLKRLPLPLEVKGVGKKLKTRNGELLPFLQRHFRKSSYQKINIKAPSASGKEADTLFVRVPAAVSGP